MSNSACWNYVGADGMRATERCRARDEPHSPSGPWACPQCALLVAVRAEFAERGT